MSRESTIRVKCDLCVRIATADTAAAGVPGWLHVQSVEHAKDGWPNEPGHLDVCDRCALKGVRCALGLLLTGRRAKKPKRRAKR